MAMKKQKNEFVSAIEADNEKLTKHFATIGICNLQTAKEAIREILPPQKPLWRSFWNEGEVCCLFADSNLGKSILAVQIASEISQIQKVVYFDFELSQRQFHKRYTDDNGNVAEFNENLIRATINTEKLSMGANLESSIIETLESVANQKLAKVLVIDNLSYLCLGSEDGKLAGNLMTQITALKKKYDLSILIVGHTPKRTPFNPITLNDLAGSKQLANFFDSVFAIGKSAKDENIRYIKQLKTRNSSFDYDTENVLTATIDKENAFLKFVFGECINERALIKEPTDDEREKEISLILELHKQGKSLREIEKQTKISKSKVHRILRNQESQA